jgi:hypothetical protein
MKRLALAISMFLLLGSLLSATVALEVVYSTYYLGLNHTLFTHIVINGITLVMLIILAIIGGFASFLYRAMATTDWAQYPEI